MREIANKQESSAQSIRNFYIDGPTWTNSNKPSANEPNTSNSTATQEELARYVACVFAPSDVVEVRRLPSGKSSWHLAGELAKSAESLVRDNQHGQHIYVGANPTNQAGDAGLEMQLEEAKALRDAPKIEGAGDTGYVHPMAQIVHTTLPRNGGMNGME